MTPAYTVLRPANRYASRLPNVRGGLVYKLVTPRLFPARFGEYLLALDAGAAVDGAEGFEDFLYALSGSIDLDGERLGAGSWAYLPPSEGFALSAPGAAEVLWLKRRHETFPGLDAPPTRVGHRDDEPFSSDTGVPGFRRRELLDPLDPRHDFNMSLLAFEPGVGLDKVEVHDEEHGLYMTSGAGVYLLGDDRHEVAAHDFIYMAPYCPQGFVATGPDVAEYLLYKDVHRDGF